MKSQTLFVPRPGFKNSSLLEDTPWKLNAIRVEEFGTFDWVRFRIGVPKGLSGDSRHIRKAIEYMHLGSMCDGLTWHWVCNHKCRNVSV
jgi:hypothetical protein